MVTDLKEKIIKALRERGVDSSEVSMFIDGISGDMSSSDIDKLVDFVVKLKGIDDRKSENGSEGKSQS